MDAWRWIAERKIEEAMAEGAFTNLSGAGAPLCLDEDPFVDTSLRMAHRLLKNNGFAPAWIEEGKDIDRDLETLRADLRRAAGTGDPERFRERVHALNRRIVGFNLKAPAAVCHKLPVDAEGEIARGDRR
ncbi:MAG: DUF1992 domain-containing protein [Bryobacteraceae bacterium]|jgi:hypothetical protein